MWHIKISGIAARHKKNNSRDRFNGLSACGKCRDRRRQVLRRTVGLVTVKDFSYIRNLKRVFKRFVNKFWHEFHQKIYFDYPSGQRFDFH